MLESLYNTSSGEVWKYFSEICDIPHPSGYEKKLGDYIVSFAVKNKLPYFQDKFGNIYIDKPAFEGFEKSKTTILQCHLDMVPQKIADKDFDFTKDPIKPFIDGGWVTADGTTLGADNGIGVAASLAILADKELKHGPVRGLFTVQEETGLTGAAGLDSGVLDGDILLNLDSEDEGQLFVGCAGGVRTDAIFDLNMNKIDDSKYQGLKFIVGNLRGGHSGCDIHLGRGNANKIIVRLLWHLFNEYAVLPVEIDGGTLDNAIPRDAYAVVAVPIDNFDDVYAEAEAYALRVKHELFEADPDFSLVCENVDIPDQAFDTQFARKLLDSLLVCPNGVQRMSTDLKGIVETSTNLATIKIVDNKLTIGTSQRSSVSPALQELSGSIKGLFELAGADVAFRSAYPGWEVDMNSPIMKLASLRFKELFGYTPDVTSIHAGLECGLLGAKNTELDMLSFGPEIRNPHSPDERTEIASVENFYTQLKDLLFCIKDL